jgi:acyl-CoA synthetase (AMP-forming)/AMP-acid ligase II
MTTTGSCHRTFAEILCARAEARPDGRAYTFLQDGEREGASLTWATLEERSRDVAAVLRCVTQPGGHVLLLFPPGVDFVPAFFGSLRARTIAVPSYPPSGSRTDRVVARLRAMAADATFSVVLTPAPVFAKRDAMTSLIPELEAIPWLNSDEIPAGTRATDDVAPNPAEIALLQYTSGSTSRPRGVMVTHGNLLHNLASSAGLAAHGSESIAVTWLPVNHDMGLIDGILQPAFSGFPVWLMSPASFLQRPLRWLQAISRVRATHSGGPDFAYELCARRIAPADRASLDLGSWRTAFNGSEPVRCGTLESFQRAFGEHGFRWEAFRPAYGLAESTLLVTSSGPDEEPHVFHGDGEALRAGTAEIAKPGRQSVALVSSGRSSGGTTIAIVDPVHHTRCAPGRVGEIWVRGASVAVGYWNKEADTDATFNARICDGDGPYLRTGDLGFTRGGHLFVTGRIKDLLIVRGLKHYPQDIEATTERAHPSIKPHCTAAFNMEDGNAGDTAAVVAELEQRSPGEAWTAAEMCAVATTLAQAVSTAHGFVPRAITLVEPGSIPRTTSGKIERYRCRDLLLPGNTATVFQWTSEAPAAETPGQTLGDERRERFAS